MRPRLLYLRLRPGLRLELRLCPPLYLWLRPRLRRRGHWLRLRPDRLYLRLWPHLLSRSGRLKLPGPRLPHPLGSRFLVCGGGWFIAGTWLKRRLGAPSLEGPWRDCPFGLDGGLTRQRRLPRTEPFGRRQLLNMSLLLRG